MSSWSNHYVPLVRPSIEVEGSPHDCQKAGKRLELRRWYIFTELAPDNLTSPPQNKRTYNRESMFLYSKTTPSQHWFLCHANQIHTLPTISSSLIKTTRVCKKKSFAVYNALIISYTSRNYQMHFQFIYSALITTYTFWLIFIDIYNSWSF